MPVLLGSASLGPSKPYKMVQRRDGTPALMDARGSRRPYRAALVMDAPIALVGVVLVSGYGWLAGGAAAA